MQVLSVVVNNTPTGYQKVFVGAGQGQTAAYLVNGAAITFSIGTGWNSADYISSVTFYHVVNGLPTQIGTWTPPNAGYIAQNNTTYFSVTPNAPIVQNGTQVPNSSPNSTPSTVCVQDVEAIAAGGANDIFTYQVALWTPGGYVTVDPELVDQSDGKVVTWGNAI